MSSLSLIRRVSQLKLLAILKHMCIFYMPLWKLFAQGTFLFGTASGRYFVSGWPMEVGILFWGSTRIEELKQYYLFENLTHCWNITEHKRHIHRHINTERTKKDHLCFYHKRSLFKKWLVSCQRTFSFFITLFMYIHILNFASFVFALIICIVLEISPWIAT